jgi:hypothetical protein
VGLRSQASGSGNECPDDDVTLAMQQQLGIFLSLPDGSRWALW